MMKYWIWLSLLSNGRYQLIRKLINELTTPENIWNTNFRNYPIEENLKELLLSNTLKIQAEKLYEYSIKNNIKLTSYIDTDYPKNLLEFPSPPPVLYYKGDILPKDECAIAIVGSRNSSEYGQKICQNISSSLSKSGITIVSGMARGIDSIAHSACLKENGRTIAVLGSGVDVIYPYENKPLYEQIIVNGYVISEFYPRIKPISRNFPIRNRIISGLSLATIVVEANEKSGSIITAGFASEQGREVFAVPGNLYSKYSAGTNKLIKDGAHIFTSINDVIDELNLCINHKLSSSPIIKAPHINLSDKQKLIYNTLSDVPTHFDIIVERTNLLPSEIASEITILEISGLISEKSGNFFTKKVLIV